jgi:aryl-alcohol dehydrogenase-like predicted oxidoreductase
VASIALNRARRRSADATRSGRAASRSAYQCYDDSPGHLRTQIEASLRRLQTDHIDVYQLHAPPHVRPHLFDELDDLVRSGKVGRFGIGADSVDVALQWSTVPAVRVLQVPFGILDPEAATDLLPCAGSWPVEVWIRGVLGGGLFALVARDPAAAAADPKGAVLARLSEVSARTGHAVDALAIGYVRAFSGVSAMLVGISSRRHLDRNLALVAAPALSDDVLAELADIAVAATAARSCDG